MYPWCWTQWRYYRKHSAADVSPLLRGEHFLKTFDSMLRDTLMEEMTNDGVNEIGIAHV